MSEPVDDRRPDDTAADDVTADDVTADDVTADDEVADDVTADDEVAAGGGADDRATGRAPADADVAAQRARRLREETDDGPTIPMEEYRTRSRRSFLAFGALGIGAFLGFRHLQNRPTEGRIPDAIRRGLELNESVWETVQREGATSRSYSVEAREDIRVNGRIGLRSDLDEASWTVRVVGVDGDELEMLDLADVQALGGDDMVWRHKCIEGWSNIVHWTGTRFSAFAERYAADQPDWDYVSLRTPDEEYYVGLDRFTMLHEQTLLAWQLNGEPLTPEHGAPLRLVTPIKYGIKQLKRIGTIEFTNERPDDYWAERGYDWHAGF